MSRSAHAKSAHKIRKLPSCPKCRTQMMLVMVNYDNRKGSFYEWECFKCTKHFPQHAFKEEKLDKEDQLLIDWCRKNNEQESRRNSRKSNKGNKRHKPK